MGWREFIARLYPITGEQLDDETVTYDKIADATITADKIAAGAIVAAGIAAGTITNDKLDASAVTEAVTVAKTFTHASLADAAGILGSQLSGSANIAGTQLASNAAIAGSQLGVGALHQVKTSIGHANATPAIAVLPAFSVLIDVFTYCTETYTATIPTIDIGYAGGGNSNKILPTASIGKTITNVSGDDPAVRGTDLYVAGAQNGTGVYDVTTWAHPKPKFYAAQTTVIATIAGGTGNAGTMDVYLSYIQTA